MRWNILDRNMHVLLSPDTRADASLPIYHDKQTIELKNNCAIGTYDFTVNQQDPDAKTLQLGNYISFVDKYGKTRLYTLMSHEGDEYEQIWHAEDIGLDLINEVADKWHYTEPHSFAWYAENLLLYDSGWSIGINEIGNLTRSLTFDGQSDSVLTRLGDLANQFDGAEIDFEVQMSGSAVTKQVINVYKKLGSDLTQQRFVDAVNLKALSTNGSINDLRTAMIGYGSTPDNGGENAEPITFANIEYDDGRYFTLKGDKTVCDRVAGQTWARAGAFDATNKNALKGYIVGIYTYETKDANELLKRTITNLKTVNEPQIGYEADLLDLQADIGDTVQIAHRQYNPPIYLSARVQEVENCYTEAGQDTGKLGNYQILESNIDPRITDMIIKQAAQKASYIWLRYADDDKGTNMSYLPTGKKYYAMVTSIGSATPSDDPADYAGHWIEIAKDGTPGKPGADGKTPYFHTAWADSVDGKTGFSKTDSAGKSYLGTYADFTEVGSTDPTKYTWSLIKGADGKDGIAGKDGVGVKATAITYAQSTSGTTPPTTGWTAGVPTLIKGQYLWTKTVWTYTDNSSETGYSVTYISKDGNNGTNGVAGKDGTGIKSTVIEYVGAVSGTSKPTDGWSTTIPTVPAGQYLWTRTTWQYTDGTSEQGFTNALMGRTGATGAKGKDGVAGKDGVGIKSTIITYQLSSSGTTTPTGAWSTTVPTLNKGKYLWTRTTLTYTDNSSEPVYSVSYVAKDGNNGSNGVAGKDGVGIKSTTITYQSGTSGTVQPTGTWVANPPSVTGGNYLWTKTTWSYTDGTSESGYSVAKMGDKGDKGDTGNGIKSVVASYQNSTSGTVIPTGSWATTPPDTPQGQYLWTRNLTTFTNGSESTSYSVAYNAKDGPKGDKGDPGSDNVPVVTVGTSYPTKPKSGDIFWLTDSDRNVIGYYVYNGSTWVANKIDAKTIAADTFNGLTFNGMTFNGSAFNNAFDFTEDGYRYTGTTTISNANYKTTYLRHNVNKTEPDATGELLISPYRFSNALYRGNGKSILDNSVELFNNVLQFTTNTNKGSGQTIRISRLTSTDAYDTGWQTITPLAGMTVDSNNPWQVRRIGHIAMMRGGFYMYVAANDAIVGKLPFEFRPDHMVRPILMAQNDKNYHTIFTIYPNGNIIKLFATNSTYKPITFFNGVVWMVEYIN